MSSKGTKEMVVDVAQLRPARDSSRTRRAILLAATSEFAEFGYSGARVERIVEQASTNMRLVYHHFSNKKGLYAAVIEQAYEEIRKKEQLLELDTGDALQAMRRLVEFTIEHFRANPAFLKLTTYENMQKGQVVKQAEYIRAISAPLIEKIGKVIENGIAAGSVKRRVDPLQLYISIVSLACHHINNVHTLSATFNVDLSDPQWLAERREHVVELIMSYLVSAKGKV